ncbi:uracil-DNA glycosylase [Massilia violaceinigra]|uniref:Uracil-DNA glycosylase n=1 Tax=Massilia violaceinigra TaxID=2045208 RepID=A0A2D2DSK1_9BURK|nr:uracil-DNA glycosylase [Massilia violaceinigra]ATQ77960.1 uracil-DNA glycosylase [Massilia violaceinigra]
MSTSARDNAFLQEMGIGPLWTLRDAMPDEALSDELAAPAQEAAYEAAPVPAAVSANVPTAVPTAVTMPAPPAVVARAVPPAATPAASPATDSAWGEEPPGPPPTEEEIAAMDWAQLKNAIANCTRCGLCKGGRKPVYGNGAKQASWFVAAGASTASDEKERQPVSGEPGKLLANMLAAVELSRDSNVYVTNLIKCRPTSANGGDRAPSAEEALACRPYLDRELALSGAPLVLTLGQIAANALQGKPLQETLAGSRGQVHEVGGVKLVATLHPGELLRRGADKALAWADLCLARAHDGRPG